MDITLIDGDSNGRMVIAGQVTKEHSAILEAGILYAMRRYSRLQVDLSGVAEIDGNGLRLLQLMQSLGGESVDIVAASPVVAGISAKDYGPQRRVAQFH
jgi:ABC-type transporter Mla MlaB component